MKNFRKKNGITLMALVITIIILLILATITIVELKNKNLFSKTIESRNKYKKSEEEENNILDDYENKINEFTGGNVIKNVGNNEVITNQSKISLISEEMTTYSNKFGTVSAGSELYYTGYKTIKDMDSYAYNAFSNEKRWSALSTFSGGTQSQSWWQFNYNKEVYVKNITGIALGDQNRNYRPESPNKDASISYYVADDIGSFIKKGTIKLNLSGPDVGTVSDNFDIPFNCNGKIFRIWFDNWTAANSWPEQCLGALQGVKIFGIY